MTVHLSDYKHLFRGEDATLALQEALYQCKTHPGSTLKLGGGTLNFSGKYAYQKEYYISNNDYSRKNIIFPLIGMTDTVIDGEGAELLFEGEVLPFVVDGSSGVKIKNLSIDYPHPYFFQADITAAAEDFLELEFDESQFDATVEDERVIFTNKGNGFKVKTGRVMVMEFDKDTTAPSSSIPAYHLYMFDESDGWFLERMYRYVKPKQLASNKIRFDGHFGHIHNVGNKLICTCGPGRRCPGMLLNDSSDTVIENVTMYSSAGMGIVGQLCENITLSGVKMIPNKAKGRYLSVNADATHFINCTGAVRLEGCIFTNMLDDALNCHGNYLKIAEVIDSHTLLATFGHHQQQGVNVIRVGDAINLVDNLPMTPIARLTVKASTLISSTFVRVEFEEELPEIKDGFTLENFTRMPELYINNCESGYNRPRGFLPSTWKKTVITNNTFYNMNTAIHFTGDSNSWFEAGGVRDVTVKGNRFVNSAYAGGSVIAVSPHLKDMDTLYHSGIVIEDNYFELHEKRFLAAKNVDGLIFKNNTYKQNDSLPAHGEAGEGGFKLEPSCANTDIEPVKEI